MAPDATQADEPMTAPSSDRCHVNATLNERVRPIVYWHRDLPPLDADPIAEHTVEATSSRVTGKLAHRDQLWNRCHADLMTEAESRLAQEVARLEGDFAHVHDEAIEPRHDDATGQGWLHGRFDYMLYRRPQVSA
jgi:hypothetical protein